MKEMKTIERANVILGIAATALAGVLWGGRGMAAAAVGAALACVNFVAIRRLGGRAIRSTLAATATTSDARAAGRGLALAIGLLVKMTALFALVWIAVRVLALPVLPFALGFSVFVVSILIVGLRAGARPEDDRDLEVHV